MDAITELLPERIKSKYRKSTETLVHNRRAMRGQMRTPLLKLSSMGCLHVTSPQLIAYVSANSFEDFALSGFYFNFLRIFYLTGRDAGDSGLTCHIFLDNGD
jgi:hypothetical protein